MTVQLTICRLTVRVICVLSLTFKPGRRATRELDRGGQVDEERPNRACQSAGRSQSPTPVAFLVAAPNQERKWRFAADAHRPDAFWRVRLLAGER